MRIKGKWIKFLLHFTIIGLFPVMDFLAIAKNIFRNMIN